MPPARLAPHVAHCGRYVSYQDSHSRASCKCLSSAGRMSYFRCAGSRATNGENFRPFWTGRCTIVSEIEEVEEGMTRGITRLGSKITVDIGKGRAG